MSKSYQIDYTLSKVQDSLFIQGLFFLSQKLVLLETLLYSDSTYTVFIQALAIGWVSIDELYKCQMYFNCINKN